MVLKHMPSNFVIYTNAKYQSDSLFHYNFKYQKCKYPDNKVNQSFNPPDLDHWI